ncbi:MAG: sigma-70 family RNA polymerase sigma factor [Acidimicrobiia bacterium]|nr:sigma-70 family RNA polymerase sigma factor [Acidimicrobiia bacterium]
MERHEEGTSESFEAFFARVEPRLRQAMTATFGPDTGREAALDALSYSWEHWEKVRQMSNPTGYVFVVARDRQRKKLRRRPPIGLPEVNRERAPLVEPALPSALGVLPEQQRSVVMLLHCFEWTMSEVAELLGVSKSTVQTHAERGMSQLRAQIGVKA